MKTAHCTIATENFMWECIPYNPTHVVVSIPHDPPSWSNDFNGLWVRRREYSKPDVHAWIIALELMQRVPIYVIRSTIHRAYLELNTYRDEAFNDPSLAVLYDLYHSRIHTLLQLADQEKPNQGLLIDLHGFSNQPPYGPFDCILGTYNRKTVRANSDADKHLAQTLHNNGVNTFLPKERPLIKDEPDWYNGKATVRTHGGTSTRTAIQLETHKIFRGDDPEPRSRLVTALEEFIRAYNKYEFE